MKLYRVTSLETAANYMATRLDLLLGKGKKVLWLVPGGSSLALAVVASKKIKANTARLSVTLTDERWGEPEHPDSNWKQLIDAGFNLPKATLQPVLKGGDLATTAKEYDQTIEQDFKEADYVLCLTGVGTDGHTLGIKPKSPATNSRKLVEGFSWDDYDRLTLTVKALDHVDEVLVYAVGKEKQAVIEDMQKNLKVEDQPAQALKHVSKLIVFNNFKGEIL